MEDGAVRPFCRAGCETAARESVWWSGSWCGCGGGCALCRARERGEKGLSVCQDPHLGGRIGVNRGESSER